VSYSAWAAGFGGIAADVDSDLDGFSNRAEYFFATTPLAASSFPAITASIDAVGGVAYLSLTFTQRLGADDVLAAAELSADLVGWDPREVAVQLVSAQPNGDGTATMTYRSQTPVTAKTREFIRLRLAPR
jgi:hypothetical protein